MVSAMKETGRRVVFDLERQTVRDLNQFLHGDLGGVAEVAVANPDGAHSIAVGLNAPVRVDIDGHAGYYAAGMNKEATVVVHGNAGPGLAENMMSGRVEVSGFASGGAGASAHGGLLVTISLGLGIVCNLETLAMSAMLPVWQRDVPTLRAAWRLRSLDYCGLERNESCAYAARQIPTGGCVGSPVPHS